MDSFVGEKVDDALPIEVGWLRVGRDGVPVPPFPGRPPACERHAAHGQLED
ncbi:MAG: hypothetical protein WD271_15255 [Acidimicrobiia bacterium]